MTNTNKERHKQLGMSYGTANGRLKKIILFNLLKRLDENYCYQCKKIIENEKELSIEHKKPWLRNNTKLFWDLDNIAFSHLSCNSKAVRNYNKGKIKHPSVASYNHRHCRCAECKNIVKLQRRKQRKKGIKT